MREYGGLLLIQRVIKCQEVIELLRKLVKEDVFVIGGINPINVKINSSGDLEMIPSKKAWGSLKPSNWPTYRIDYYLGSENLPLPRGPLVSLESPLYPDAYKAILDFLGMRPFNIERKVFIEIPDYRLRISECIIFGNKIRVEIDSQVFALNTLTAKIYADFGIQQDSQRTDELIIVQSELDFKEPFVEYEFSDKPTSITIAVVEKKTGKMLDYREYRFDWAPEHGITIQLEEYDYREIIRRLETKTVEFKVNLKDSDDFLESVVAFANTEGGIIFIGVENDGRIKGCFIENVDQITNLIAGNLEPKPDFEEETIRIDGKPITVVKVHKGLNKPYSHKDLGVYVRIGTTDRHATRTDLDKIYSEKASPQM